MTDVTKTTETEEVAATTETDATEELNTESTDFTPTVNEQQNITEDLPMYSMSEALDDVRKAGLVLSRFASRFEQINEALERNGAVFFERIKAEDSYQKRLMASEGRDPTPEEGSEWARSVSEAMPEVYGAGLTDFSRPDSEWGQTLEYEGRKMGIGETRVTSSKANSGDNFIKLLTQRSGVGTGINVPLYHSGIWVRIESPSRVEISNLRYRLGEQKVQLGMETKGSAFSAYTHTITMLAVDFVLDHVTASNVDFTSPTDLKVLISQLDIQTLLWGMASAMYPRGFHYSFPCIANPSECNHITTRNVNLRRMKWEDKSRLSKKQRKHMAQMFTRCTEADLELYRKEFDGYNGRRVWVTEETGIDLKIPSIYEYETASREWIDGIVELSATQFNEPVDSERRTRRINQFANDTSGAQSRHWIKGLVVKGDSEDEVVVTEDSDVVTMGVKSVFSDEEHIAKFIDAVDKYIIDTKVTAIALHSVECPACGKSPATELFHKRFPHLVEIDVVADFFTLVGLK